MGGHHRYVQCSQLTLATPTVWRLSQGIPCLMAAVCRDGFQSSEVKANRQTDACDVLHG